MRCRNCGLPLHQRPEKALSGEVQMVWADSTDAWVCSFTGNEHVAVEGEPARPVKVIVRHGDTETAVDLTLAEYGNFIVRPVQGALDDGEAAWELDESDPERHRDLTRWSDGLYGVTS